MIYDITQPLFECEVYPGDPRPEKKILASMDAGDVCNVTSFWMCAHNGTHVDAPLHFLKDGKGIDRVALEKFTGPAFVADFEGDVSAADARAILEKAGAAYPGAEKRILIKGRTTVTEDAARVFADAGIDLIGNESQTIGPIDSPMAIHRLLLGAEAVLLEGIRLARVPEGVYFLSCAPLNLGNADGAPCRAILMDSLPDIGGKA